MVKGAPRRGLREARRPVRCRWAVALVPLVPLALLLGWRALSEGHAPPPARERLIGTLAYRAAEVLVSRSREHVAYVAIARGRLEDWDAKMRSGEQEALMVQDGRAHGRYTAVLFPALSPDGRHVAYVAQRDDGMQAAVVDGRESPWYEGRGAGGVGIGDPNPRTGEFFYLGRLRSRCVLGIDVVERRYPYDVVDFVWSPDGRRQAYLAQPEGSLSRISMVSPFAPSLPGTADGPYRVVVDGIMGKPYDHIPQLTRTTFCPDGSVYAYAARQGDEWFYVVNGKAGRAYSHVDWRPQWVASGHELAYLALRGNQGFLVMGDKELAGPRGCCLILSPDGRRWAYLTSVEGGSVVIDGVEGPHYRDVSPAIFFSPDSRHVAYTAHEADQSAEPVLVVDGDSHSVDARLLTFSPDSQHLAYVAHTEQRDALVVDGRTRDEHRGISPLWFSPDSRHVAYVAHAKRLSDLAYFPSPEPVGGHAVIDVAHLDKVRVVVDGQPGPGFRGVCLQAACFRDGGVVEYVAVRGNEVYQVQQSVPDQDWVSQ